MIPAPHIFVDNDDIQQIERLILYLIPVIGSSYFNPITLKLQITAQRNKTKNSKIILISTKWQVIYNHGLFNHYTSFLLNAGYLLSLASFTSIIVFIFLKHKNSIVRMFGIIINPQMSVFLKLDRLQYPLLLFFFFLVYPCLI